MDVFRELKLPVIDWGTHPKWRSNSEEGKKYLPRASALSSQDIRLAAKFLFKLGLRRYPPLAELVGLMASGDEAIRNAARKYFFDNYTIRYAADYDPDAFSNVAFIPAVKGGTRCLARPHEVRLPVAVTRLVLMLSMLQVFSSPEWAALG